MAIQKILVAVCFTILAITLDGQLSFTDIRTVWDDDFSEWEVTFRDGENRPHQGHFSRKWPLRDNWEEWVYDLGDYSGFIKTKWRGDMNRWELRGNNRVVDITARWRNDLNEWTIAFEGRRIVVSTEYRNDANTWAVRSDAGTILMYTAFIDDPRDWIVEDEYWDLAVEQKMAIFFICLFQSISKP